MLVSLGELSSARQALVGAELAPRKQGALNALRDPTRRHVPEHHCRTDDTPYPQCVRIGMTTKDFRSLLDDVRATHLFFHVGIRLSREEVPPSVVGMVRQGRKTAQAKPNGGVRGIAAGDVWPNNWVTPWRPLPHRTSTPPARKQGASA